MENACTRNVLINSARISAIPMRIGSSFQKARGFFPVVMLPLSSSAADRSVGDDCSACD